jgi:hypothetical protein
MNFLIYSLVLGLTVGNPFENQLDHIDFIQHDKSFSTKMTEIEVKPIRVNVIPMTWY